MNMTNDQAFRLHWQGKLHDYVTALDWLPNGQVLGAASAAGEVVLYPLASQDLIPLPTETQQPIDQLAFSTDQQFLAAGGQDGLIRVWHLTTGTPNLTAVLPIASGWVEQLVWSPACNYLAFSSGRMISVWDAERQTIVATLTFGQSSVLDLTWHPGGDRLTAAGYQSVKTWEAGDWHTEPHVIPIPAACIAVAWSSDGRYLAAGNLDRTILVTEIGNPLPWVMQGFMGKVRQLAWSTVADLEPVLIASSADTIVLWLKNQEADPSWDGLEWGYHNDIITAIALHPYSNVVTSAGADGKVCLWYGAEQVLQTFSGAPTGFSTLAWQPQGKYLAAGGQAGELFVWTENAW